MSLFTRSFRDRRRGLAWRIVGVVMLAAMYVALYPSIKDVLTELDQYPEELLRALGLEGASELGTVEGYLEVELFSIMAPIVMIVHAVILGVGAIAGSERKGEMELILANPISRSTVFVQRFAAMLVSTLVLVVVLWIALASGTLFGAWDSLDSWNLLQAMISLVLLGWAFGAAGMALSALTGSTGMSFALVGAVAISTYILNSFAQIVDVLEPLKWISPFYYYLGSNPLQHGLNWWHTLVPLAITTIAFFVGQFMFERRDLQQGGS